MPASDGEPTTVSPLLTRLINGWKVVAGASATAVVVAILISFVLPRAYTSSATFTPEEQKNANLPSGLGGLAGQFGLLMGGSSQSPEFYSRLLNSRFLKGRVVSATLGSTTLIQYYGVGGRPDSVERAIRKFGGDYSVSVDRLGNSVRVDVELRSPELAQMVTQSLLDEVDHFNSSIRRTMAHSRRRFVDDRMSDAARELASAESALKEFLNRNRGGNSPELQFERGRLERRVQLDQDLYVNLARQAQTAGIDEVNDTPVISIIDPPFLPVRPSRPNRKLLVMLAAILGAGVAAATLILRPSTVAIG